MDAVYGSSAGALVGTYFISGQLPHFGPEVYYDVLTAAGREFIDLAAVLRSCGLGALDLRPRSLVSLFRDRLGRPVLNLDYLFDTIVTRVKPLRWDAFWQKQVTRQLQLKVSGVCVEVICLLWMFINGCVCVRWWRAVCCLRRRW